jgi:import inner membrane translocase subunit TIM54
LVAAAVDFEMISGKRHGDIANKIAEEIKVQRRIAVGLDPPPPIMAALAGYQPLDVMYRRKLEGGIVIVGRPTFKEFMAGTKRGWTESLEKIDREEALARDLESDGRFDEAEEPSQLDVATLDGEPIPTPSKLPSGNGIYSPLQMQRPPPVQRGSESIPAEKNIPPAVIPELPPLLFVPFTNLIGFTQIPLMMWDFFNQRHKVRSGSEAAYRLIMKQTRPIIPPPSLPFTELQDPDASVAQSTDQHGGDLDFDKEAEAYFKPSLSSTVVDIEKARESYYAALPAKLETARALSRGTREPTKDEVSFPPPTEVELRAERMKKELRWRGDIDGWELVRREKGVVWDDRFAASMRVFGDPTIEGSDFSITTKTR